MPLSVDYEYAPWWAEKDSECAVRAISDSVKMLDEAPEQKAREELFDSYARKYDARKYLELGETRYNFNVCQAVVDAAVAQLVGVPNSVMVLTEEGRADMQERGKRLNQYVKGQFDHAGHTAAQRQTAHCGAVFGTGPEGCFTGPDGKRGGARSIGVRAVDPRNLLIHPAATCGRSYFDADGRGPTHLYEFIECPVDEAIAAFPNCRKEVLSARPHRQRDQQRRQRDGLGGDCTAGVVLASSWWRGWDDRRKRNVCRHVVSSDDHLLSDETFDYDALPYSFYRWQTVPDDFWGRGLVDLVSGIQDELDDLCEKISEHMRLATSQIWTQKGGVQAMSGMSNKVWAQYQYTTAPPTLINMPPIDPAYFQERDRLFEQAFRQTGVSQFAASGMKPAGVNAARAIRLYKDMGNQRLAVPVAGIAQQSVEVAGHLIAAAKDLDAKQEGGHNIMAPNKRGFARIRWSEVDMDRDQYMLTIAPTNFLDDTPSGKLDGIQELVASFPQLAPFAMKALTYPDLEAFVSLATARYDEVASAVDGIVAKGVATKPDPNTDLAVAVPFALATLARAKADGEDPEVLDMLREYLEECSALQAAAQAAAAPPPAPPGPPGMPPPGAIPPAAGPM